ncbi:MAG: HigA family addiction module antidote protein [Deltaproteobacteria bacterium]|nr:HigA family addiction module antidote protein [Deltaproteobacteria bacterium]MBF0526559.1 HigA family addiction module antidote protein [Deltaproteobacteria bacterium]
MEASCVSKGSSHLEAYCITQAELATRTGLTKKTINEIVRGKSPITPDTALKLERTLGRPAHFWSNLERQYQEDKMRLAAQARLQSHLAGLAEGAGETLGNGHHGPVS